MTNIIKSTVRGYVRKPVTNLINLGGLAISLALVIILSVYCYSELTTDNFHKNGDRIYFYGELAHKLYTPAILKETIDQGISGIEATVRIANSWEKPVFQTGNGEPLYSDILFADKDFFKLFTYKASAGNLETALNEPMSIVITKSVAEKLFGKGQAIGKTIKYNNGKELIVTAVIEAPQANSCLSFGSVTTMEARKILQPNGDEFKDWGWSNFQTFILLKKGTGPTETAKRILTVLPEDEKKNYAQSTLLSFKSLYFSKFKLFDGNYIRCGNRTEVMILLMVAVLVLLIALVNFVNISSSQWFDKIRQTGIMKVIGAKRSTICRYVLSEALLVFLTALMASIFVAKAVILPIGNYTGINFNEQLLFSPSFLIIAIVVTIVLGLIFSIIPALQISSSSTLNNLKKNITLSAKRSYVSGILITTQFVIAIGLMAFTILVQKQVNFGCNQGFHQNTSLGIKLTQELGQKKEVLRNSLQTNPNVSAISFSQYFPGKTNSHWGTQMEQKGAKQQVDFDTFNADSVFFGILGLSIVKGQCYSNKNSTISKALVNETFVNAYKIDDFNDVKIHSMGGTSIEIVGVVKDFHYKPVNQPIVPLVIIDNSYASYCLVSLKSNDFNSLHKAVQEITKEAAKLSPDFPIEVNFLDQAVENMYQAELRFRRTFTLFAICAIAICCLGILAMSIFACQQRIKEIGVRKVNGARVTEILAMLNTDFIKWVALAFIIACPIAYYAMNKWLQNFAYKTELSWWVFALAGIVAVAVAVLTVSWQSWRAATRNPVESLRYE